MIQFLGCSVGRILYWGLTARPSQTQPTLEDLDLHFYRSILTLHGNTLLKSPSPLGLQNARLERLKKKHKLKIKLCHYGHSCLVLNAFLQSVDFCAFTLKRCAHI